MKVRLFRALPYWLVALVAAFMSWEVESGTAWLAAAGAACFLMIGALVAMGYRGKHERHARS